MHAHSHAKSALPVSQERSIGPDCEKEAGQDRNLGTRRDFKPWSGARHGIREVFRRTRRLPENQWLLRCVGWSSTEDRGVTQFDAISSAEPGVAHMSRRPTCAFGWYRPLQPMNVVKLRASRTQKKEPDRSQFQSETQPAGSRRRVFSWNNSRRRDSIPCPLPGLFGPYFPSELMTAAAPTAMNTRMIGG